MNNTAQEFGGAFGIAILVAAFTTVGSYSSTTTFITGFTAAIGVCAALAAAAAVTACLLPGRRSIDDRQAAATRRS